MFNLLKNYTEWFIIDDVPWNFMFNLSLVLSLESGTRPMRLVYPN
jgi:hypothetical protein